MKKKFSSFLVDIAEFKPSHKQRERLEKVINQINKLLDTSRSIVFICTHNSRRSQLCEFWAKYFSNHYEKNLNFYSAGVEKTEVYNGVFKALLRCGIKRLNNKLIVEKKSIRLESKTLEEIHLKSFISIFNCSDAEKNCPIDFRSIANINLKYEDPKRFDGSSLEEDEYFKTSYKIARELNYIIRNFN